MNKHKLKENLKKELLEEILDDIVDRVSERIISILPPSVKSEIALQKYSEVYGKRNPQPDFNLTDLELKAKQIQDYNKRHSALTPSKPKDFEEELKNRKRTIEGLQEDHSQY